MTSYNHRLFGARPTALAAGVVLVALSACNQKQQAAAPVPGPVPEVNIVTVREQPIPYVRDLPGRVAPLRIAEVRSRVAGLTRSGEFTTFDTVPSETPARVATSFMLVEDLRGTDSPPGVRPPRRGRRR